MQQYLELLEKVLERGVHQGSARQNMPDTYNLFGETLRFSLKDGFPAITTKSLYFKGVVGELLWMLSGSINIRYLLTNSINIWNKDAYRYYLRVCDNVNVKPVPFDVFLDKVISGEVMTKDYAYGDLGNVYGKQWRRWESGGVVVDQIQELIRGLIQEPNSRRHVVSAWNAADLTPDRAALPPCHSLFQCAVRDCGYTRYLDLSVYQRSCDVMLGLPFNIAFYALLLELLSAMTMCTPGDLVWTGGSVHLYSNHVEAAKEQLSRTPYDLPTLSLGNYVAYADHNSFNLPRLQDVTLVNYKHHPKIYAELSVGL